MHERHRDHDALAHAAGELVRILARALRGVGMPTVSSICTARSQRLLRRAGVVHAHDLGDLVADGEDRIERRHRLLKHHRDARAADRAHRLLVERAARFFAVESISLPGSMRPGGRTRRRIESAVTDLPQPDSPTSPTVSPARDVEA